MQARLAGTCESCSIYFSFSTPNYVPIMLANLVELVNSPETSRKGISCCQKSEHQKTVVSQFKPICFQFRFFDELDLTCYNVNCLTHTLSLGVFPACCRVFFKNRNTLLFRKGENKCCTAKNTGSILRRSKHFLRG